MQKSAIRKIFSVLLAVCLAFVIVPITAQAAPTGTLSIGGSYYPDISVGLSGTGWVWDTSKLTLDSTYTGEGISIFCQATDTINLEYTGNVMVAGILCDGNLEITGSSGTLTAKGYYSGIEARGYIEISGGASVTAEGTHTNSNGISSNGDITINTTGKVTAMGKGRWNAVSTSNQKHKLKIENGTVELANNDNPSYLYLATLEHTGGTLNGCSLPTTGTVSGPLEVGGKYHFDMKYDSSGTGWKWDAAEATLSLDSAYTGEYIYFSCQATDTINLIYKDDVIVEATDLLTMYGNAILCKGNLNITGSGGTLTAKGVDGGIAASGSQMSISGSASVKAEGTYTDSYGIACLGDITINTTGNVTATGKGTYYSVRANNGKLKIENGTVELKHDNVANLYDATLEHTGGTLNGKSAGIATFTIESVSIDPKSATINAGNSQQFTATVKGTGDYPKTVSWSVEGNNDMSTAIVDGLLKVSPYETAEKITVVAKSTANEVKKDQATVTVIMPSIDTFTVTFDAAGGTASASTAKANADGKLTSLPTATKDGYTFDGWYTGATGGTKITTDYVFAGDTTVYAQWTKKASGNSGSSGGGGGSSSSDNSTTTTTAKSTSTASKPVTKAEGEKAVANAISKMPEGATNATVTLKNSGELTSEVITAMENAAKKQDVTLTINLDTVVNGKVTGRISLRSGDSATKQSFVSGFNAKRAKLVDKFFSKYFKNSLLTLSMNQQGNLGRKVSIAYKLPQGMSDDNLVVYTYNSKTNSYSKLDNANLRVDSKGYVHFDTTVGGDFVISDGMLAKR